MRGIALLAAFGCSEAAQLHSSPVSRVVTLITELKAKVEADGKKEQQSYDKYACWCENTLARKAKAISDAKDLIEKLSKTILKLKGDLGAHSAEIAQLKKDIAQNMEAQKEATEVRNKEKAEFEATHQENLNCLGALDAAIKALAGAGTGKKGFLETIQEAQLLSIVSGVRETLNKAPVVDTLTSDDLKTIQKFLKAPEDFVGGRTGVMSAAQIAQNPFGDYAPQSGVIQGILKGMSDAFIANDKKAVEEEAEAAKSFAELMATKKQEQETLEATLEKQEHDSAKKTKELSDSKINRDDTEAQLKADETFFEDTKAGCKTKAGEWAERSRLRTEELTGIQKAIEILSSPEATQTFESSATTFVQIKSDAHAVSQSYRKMAFTKLRSLAAKYQSTSMAEIAVAVKTGGHFDKVMTMIDKMIELLRKEEAEDIAHRDRCEASENKNANDQDDLDHDIAKAGDTLTRLGDHQDELKLTIKSLEDEMASTKNDMEQLLEMRNEESKAFKKALKDDADAVALIEKAIVSLSQFYKNNKIPLELLQNKKEPEYSVDPDKAPETSFSGGDYGGRKGESGGIIAILEMIKEDTENEMKVSRSDDADAEAAYEKDRGSLQDTLDAQAASKVQAEKELAETEDKIADTEEFKAGKAADLNEENKLAQSIGQDCAWVKSHFDSRRDKRKAEMEGLVEAKNFLAGVEAGDDDELM